MSRARPSMYPGPPAPSHWAALEACSQALQASCSNVHSAIGILHEETADLPRLAGVVHSRRMFDLVTEPEVFSAQRALANEMGPQITELIRRAEDGLEGLKARERGLRAKVRREEGAFSFSRSLCSALRRGSRPIDRRGGWGGQPCGCALEQNAHDETRPLAQVDKRNSASRAPTPSSASAKDAEALEKQLEELRRRKDRLGAEVERLEGEVEAASAKAGRR
ncbi:SPOSA6832_01931, partial [Sporobolomyces salmonicolor]